MVTYLHSHSVSAEYVFWMMEEKHVRAFLLSTNRGMDPWIRQKWDDAEEEASEIFNPEQHDSGLPAEFYEEAVGIWPDDYFWQLSAAVIKDACALFEVFLEQQANEVLGRAGARLTNLASEDSWRWNECRAFYLEYVGVDVMPPAIEAVLWIRNKMTHLRDRLRTPAGLAELASHTSLLNLSAPATADELALGLVEHPPYAAHGVHLSQLATWRILDVIADHVGTVALTAFPYMYRGKTNAHLTALKDGTPLKVKDIRETKLFSPR